MKKFIQLFTLLFLLIPSAFAQQVKTAALSQITIVQKNTLKADSMWVIDPSKTAIYQVKPDSKGQFDLQFNPTTSSIIQIGIDKPYKWNTTLYLESGDDFRIETDFDQQTKFVGKGATKVNLLYTAAKNRAATSRSIDWKTISANEALKIYQSITQQAIDSLEANRVKISPEFYSQQKTNIKYEMLNTAALLPFTGLLYSGRKPSTLLPDNFSSLDKAVDFDDKLLSNATYKQFMIGSYSIFLLAEQLIHQGMSIDSLLNLPPKTRTELIYEAIQKKYPDGKVKSAALANALMAGFEKVKNVTAFKPLMDQYLEKYATAEDAKNIKMMYQRFNITNVGNNPPFFTLKDLAGKEVTLKDFEGKVVYMDFWASWCSPCRYEMKNGSPQLHEKFEGNNKVVFLYVSIDDRSDLWKKAIADDQIEGIHVLSAGGTKSPVAQAFNIIGIPRYIIIGKNGKIFDNDAPRPSETITVQKINEALAQ